MKTLTPEQREQGFLELQSTNKDAHLLSFLAGIRHAEEVLASQEQDAAPVGYVYSEYGNPRKNVALSNDSIPNGTPVYLHPAPREFMRLSEEEIETAYGESGHYQTLRPQDRYAVFALARAIEDALEEKNK